jgi:tRNA threonylcarbamoyladenosine biosynthesis protein TsaB
MARGHAERLFPLLRAALEEAGLGIGAVGRIAVCTGPGSFTGLRVGVAAARGLALGRGIPAVGIDRFEALAAAVARPQSAGAAPRGAGPRSLGEKIGWAERRPLAVALDGRGVVYLQRFGPDLAPLSPPAMLAPGALVPAVAPDAVPVGDGWSVPGTAPGGPGGRGEPVLLPEGLADPAVIAALAATREPGAPPAPLYLRGADAAPPREAPPPLLA